MAGAEAPQLGGETAERTGTIQVQKGDVLESITQNYRDLLGRAPTIEYVRVDNFLPDGAGGFDLEGPVNVIRGIRARMRKPVLSYDPESEIAEIRRSSEENFFHEITTWKNLGKEMARRLEWS